MLSPQHCEWKDKESVGLAAREFVYDRESKIDRLNKGLDEAAAKGWTVVGMKQ